MHKRHKPSLNTVLATIIGVIIAVFFLTHLTPELAVRGALLKEGHVRVAVTGRIWRTHESLAHVYGDRTRKGWVYQVSPNPLTREEQLSSGLQPGRFCVTTFILSFAEPEGEG